VASAQQGHRNYAKRQGTWFRREAGVHRLAGCGDDEGMADAVMKILAV
jgi:tRNA dimethylallyltransferase